MKLELFIGSIVLIFIANIYYDGKILAKIKYYNKYYKMIFIGFLGLFIYLFKKSHLKIDKNFLQMQTDILNIYQ